MRNRTRLTMVVIGFAVAVALTVATGGSAIADPPSGVTPEPTDIVGVGTGPTAFLFDQFSVDYNNQSPAGPRFYSWDAVNPATGRPGDPIVTKAGCPAIPRPNGTSAGIAALQRNVPDPVDPAAFCIDYARSYRVRQSSDPPLAPGGVVFVDMASDAVTYATRDASSGGTNAPGNLRAGQLKAIYKCLVTNWDQVGGPNAPIHAFLPQQSSEVRSFFLTALGGGKTPIKPGACVSTQGNTLRENQGVSQVLNDPDAIVPYSVAAYIAQVYHSAACLNSGCTGNPVCVPVAPENLFGCDQHGVLGLNEINGTKPLSTWPPPPPPCPQCQINLGFSALFQHFVYTVVRYDETTPDHIPLALEQFFGSQGWVCTDSAAVTDIHDYGFHHDCGTPHDR
ncbi:MAG TPA: substrate-binding domain-containing protein [Streptosporangiaceae bacterium]|nr:substrate-binding domain-containing protein [Streptosporangiaceae bacterium]